MGQLEQREVKVLELEVVYVFASEPREGRGAGRGGAWRCVAGHNKVCACTRLSREQNKAPLNVILFVLGGLARLLNSPAAATRSYPRRHKELGRVLDIVYFITRSESVSISVLFLSTWFMNGPVKQYLTGGRHIADLADTLLRCL